MALFSVARGLLALVISIPALAAQIDIPGPPGSARFGERVYALPNGNMVIVDPDGEQGRGTVHLYSRLATRISTLRGASTSDHLGQDGVSVLPSGNFVVCNPSSSIGAIANAGSVTWVNGTTGLDATVSAQNSLVGTHQDDRVGLDFRILKSGNYVAIAEGWDRSVPGALLSDAGAVTWGSGTVGVRGPVSESNSLVGRGANEKLGANITELTNGDLVVASPVWSSPDGLPSLGAVTRMSGSQGATGELGVGNSLLGSRPYDRIGLEIYPLANGNYYVGSESWSDGVALVGALTWCSGTQPCTGGVSATNSVIGSKQGDFYNLSTQSLPNGSLLVMLPFWDHPNGSPVDIGAVKVLPDNRSITGRLTLENVLHGTRASDRVGEDATLLDDGNAVVVSRHWHDGAFPAGAATWIDVGSPPVGAVSEMNSLVADEGSSLNVVSLNAGGRYVASCPQCDIDGVVDAGAVVWSSHFGSFGRIGSNNALYGRSANDNVGSSIAVLANGNYVVGSPAVDNSILFPNIGAATWVDGATGVPKNEVSRGVAVSSNNSLVGTFGGDAVSVSGIVALSNGNYVVRSQNWKNNGMSAAGAVTWAPGDAGLSGAVGLANSLVGSTPQDGIGNQVIALAGGNYVVASPQWDERLPSGEVVVDAGAVTWIDGRRGLSGSISASNSFLSSGQAESHVGFIDSLPDGSYVISSSFEDRCDDVGCVPNTGAWALGFASSPLLGRHDESNSVLGTVANEGILQTFAFNQATNQLIVGRPDANTISLLERSLFRNGFD